MQRIDFHCEHKTQVVKNLHWIYNLFFIDIDIDVLLEFKEYINSGNKTNHFS